MECSAYLPHLEITKAIPNYYFFTSTWQCTNLLKTGCQVSCEPAMQTAVMSTACGTTWWQTRELASRMISKSFLHSRIIGSNHLSTLFTNTRHV